MCENQQCENRTWGLFSHFLKPWEILYIFLKKFKFKFIQFFKTMLMTIIIQINSSR